MANLSKLLFAFPYALLLAACGGEAGNPAPDAGEAVQGAPAQ